MNTLTSSTVLATIEMVRRDLVFAIDLRPHGRDPHVVGQRRLEAIEQLGPRERPPIDEIVGLARLGRHGLDLFRDRRSLAAARPCAEARSARDSSREACVASSRVAARSPTARA